MISPLFFQDSILFLLHPRVHKVYWKEEYFAETANYLSKKYDALTLFITTPAEKKIQEKISSMLNEKPIIPYFGLDMIAAISFTRPT